MAHAAGEKRTAGKFRFVMVVIFMAVILLLQRYFMIATEIAPTAGYGRQCQYIQ